MKVMEQLSLFENSQRKLPVFSCVLCDNEFNPIISEQGTLSIVNAELSIDEFKLFAAKSPKLKRHRFGYDTFGYIEKKPVKLFIRFGNETTKSKETVFDYIDRSFPIEELFTYDYEEYKKIKRF